MEIALQVLAIERLSAQVSPQNVTFSVCDNR